MKKRRRDSSPSETDMQFNTIALLAGHLGSSNAFAQESSSADSLQPFDESEYFPDIMQIKEELSFHDSKVGPSQNLYSVPAIHSKELAHESKLSLKSKPSKLNSISESKFSPTSKRRSGTSLVNSSGIDNKAQDILLSVTPSTRLELRVNAKQVFGDFSPISQQGSQRLISKDERVDSSNP
jgi:hypothetical protein